MNFIFYSFLFITLILYSNTDDKITITVNATSGIIEKRENLKLKLLYFKIPCRVDNNITKNISKIDIEIKTKIPELDEILPSICNLNSVRLEPDSNFADTYLNCILNYTNYNSENIDNDMNLIIAYNPTYTSDVAEFIFNNFENSGKPMEINGLFIYNLETDFCEGTNFFFEMNFTSINTNPIESTVCEFEISENNIHNIATCAIPFSSNIIKCAIDASKEKVEEGEKIKIKAQNYAKCRNGQVVNIKSDSQNTLEINEECSCKFIFIKILFYLLLLLLTL